MNNKEYLHKMQKIIKARTVNLKFKTMNTIVHQSTKIEMTSTYR